MKKILLATDFSANATHAAEYGYNLAKQIKANIVLCNAIIVPAELPHAGVIVWPMEEYNTLSKRSADELKQLKAHLEHRNNSGSFKPSISYVNEPGPVADVVNNIAVSQQIDLVIMGTHGGSGLSQLILGNHCRNMIDCTIKPLLLVPKAAAIVPIKKIAFSTDFKQPEDNKVAIYALIPLARLLKAEILITHVYDEKCISSQFQHMVMQFLKELSDKSNYSHIYYRVIKDEQTESGLDWLCEHGKIDMLTMLHRPHNFFDSVLKGSHTQKMAGHISIPLLVFPAKR